MPVFKLKTTGLVELERAFESLSQTVVRNKIIRPAVTRGCRVLKAELKGRIGNASIARAVDFVVKTEGGVAREGRRAAGGEVVGKVGARKSKGGGHFHLLDQGTKERKTKKGYGRGRVKGKFWLKAATEAALPEIDRAIGGGIKDGIEREYAKLVRK